MGRIDRVPWPKLRDYLLRVSTCRSLDECMLAACVEMQAVIPFDATTGIFRASDNFNLAGIGKPSCTEAFNRYYRKIRPLTRASLVDWRRMDNEYAVDFSIPNGMHKSCRIEVAGHSTWIAVLRSRWAPDFSEDDVDTLAFIEDYLSHLFSSFDKQPLPMAVQSVDKLRDRFPGLTRREAEVCSLVACRLNTAEIAARLFLSPRTVENHLASVFDKLGVRSREQLRYLLGVLPR